MQSPWKVDESQFLQAAPVHPPTAVTLAPGAVPRVVSPPPAPPPPPPEVSSDGPPSDAAERIRVAASRGGSLKAMHTLFGVPADTFKRWLDAVPGLRQAFDEGKEMEREALHRTLYEAALYKRDLNAAQFLLKSRHSYREQEPDDSRNKVNITFNIPAAAPDLKTYVEQNGKLEAVALPRAPRVIEHE